MTVCPAALFIALSDTGAKGSLVEYFPNQNEKVIVQCTSCKGKNNVEMEMWHLDCKLTHFVDFADFTNGVKYVQNENLYNVVKL